MIVGNVWIRRREGDQSSERPWKYAEVLPMMFSLLFTNSSTQVIELLE